MAVVSFQEVVPFERVATVKSGSGVRAYEEVRRVITIFDTKDEALFQERVTGMPVAGAEARRSETRGIIGVATVPPVLPPVDPPVDPPVEAVDLVVAEAAGD